MFKIKITKIRDLDDYQNVSFRTLLNSTTIYTLFLIRGKNVYGVKLKGASNRYNSQEYLQKEITGHFQTGTWIRVND